MLFLHLDCLGVSCKAFLEISVCLICNITDQDGSWFVLKVTKNTSLLQKNPAQLLKITHRPCCKQFHGGTIIFLCITYALVSGPTISGIFKGIVATLSSPGKQLNTIMTLRLLLEDTEFAFNRAFWLRMLGRKM